MARESLLTMGGVIDEALSTSRFRVALEDGRNLHAILSGRLRKTHIQIMVGDRVTLDVSPLGLSHGLILTHQKLERAKH